MSAPGAEGLWDSRDVAAYLKVSRAWVYLHAESGTLPCVKIGGLLRFYPEEIREFARGEVVSRGVVVDMKAARGRK